MVLFLQSPLSSSYVVSELTRLILPVQDKSMYDASHELQYLDMVFEEALRMYPPASV